MFEAKVTYTRVQVPVGVRLSQSRTGRGRSVGEGVIAVVLARTGGLDMRASCWADVVVEDRDVFLGEDIDECG